MNSYLHVRRFSNVATAWFIFLIANSGAAQTPAQRPIPWAKAVEIGTMENSYQIDEFLYRSEQPSKRDMLAAQEAGVKTVVNLRNVRRDNHKARNTGLNLVHIPINTWRMDYDDVVASLRAIKAAEKPVVLHCIHGSDRTGVVSACYRMTEQGWTKEDAIDEFLNGGYGYHDGWFPKILTLLRDMDVERLKKDVAR